MEGHPEYEVKEILSARKQGRGIQYLVKWKDYGNEENTWEPCHHLDHAPDLIQEFLPKISHCCPKNCPGIRNHWEILHYWDEGVTRGYQGKNQSKEKDYCQDQLSTRLTITRKGRSSDWKGQEFHQNDGIDNLFPSGGEVQGFPSEQWEKTTCFHQEEKSKGSIGTMGKTTCFHQEEKSRDSKQKQW